MTDTAAEISPAQSGSADVHIDVPAKPEAAGAPAGSPALIGVPTFMVGSIALALYLVGFTPATAVGASIPIIMTATGLGQLIAAVWAAALAQNALASIFGTFAGFWLSYAALVLGLTHNWFGIAAGDAVRTQEVFLTSWLVVIVVLTLVSLRLPFAITLLLGLVDAALLCVLVGTANASTGVVKAGGWFAFGFIAVGAYLFADAMAQATGGTALPMGRPVLA